MQSFPPSNRTCRTGLIAPRLGVVLAVLVGLAGLAFLIPDRDQLLTRFLSDGDTRAAGGLLPQSAPGDPAAMTRALTLEVLTLGERGQWDRATVEVLAKFLATHEDFAPAAEVVMENIGRIPARVRGQVFSALVDRALGEGQLPLAVQAQDLILAHSPTLTPALVRKAVTTYRYNGDPAKALDLINRLQDQGPDLPADLRELRVALARETSRPDVAFKLLAIKIRATRDRNELRTLIPQAVQVGVEAGQMETLVPLYRRYVDTFGQDDDPLVRDYAFRLARTHEWTGHPDRAFDAYLALAAEGDREALDRVLDLNAGLFRTAEVLDLLVDLDELVEGDDELLALTARLLAEAARRDEAVERYGLLLERQPENAEAHFRLALVHDEGMEFSKAHPHLLAAHRLEPENLEVLHRLARCCIALRNYDEALGHLETLISLSDDPEYAEEFNTLAYSLRDRKALRKSLARLLELKPGPVFALALADLHAEEGNDSQAAAVLEDVLGRIDNDLAVRLQLAQLLLRQNRPARVLQVLADIPVREVPDIVPHLIGALGALSSGPQAGLLPAALRRHGAELARSEALSPAHLVNLANLERRYGSAQRGQQLLRRALRECTAPGQLAQAHFALGNAREALPHQLKHLRATARVTSEDYHLLGDIYAALGQQDNAESAYKYAVVLLKKRLTRTTNR